MLPSQLNGSPKRASLFARPSASQTSQSQSTRPKSAIITSSNGLESTRGHLRNSSVSQLSPILSSAGNRERSNSAKNSPSSGTFAPSFIKSEELRRGADQIRGIEGDNDFSGNKYVWLRDNEKAFVRGLVLEELDGGRMLVQSDDGEVWRPMRHV
jgi:myosin protein heavy chain